MLSYAEENKLKWAERTMYRLKEYWPNYINGLNAEEKEVAERNLEFQKKIDSENINYYISESVKKFKLVLQKESDIVAVGSSERWGGYWIYVVVNAKTVKDLERFRKQIPVFYEGWEVDLYLPTLWERIRFIAWRVFSRKK